LAPWTGGLALVDSTYRSEARESALSQDAAVARAGCFSHEATMKLPLSAMFPLSAMTVLFMAGCRTPASQTLLERENFQQEKRIEDLEDCLQECRQENSALKKRLGGGAISLPSSDSPRIMMPPDAAAPSLHSSSGLPLFQPPKVDRGTEASSGDSPAPPNHSPALPDSSQPEQWVPPKESPLEKPDRIQPDSGATTSSYQEEDSPRPVRIAIVGLLTNGHQYGGHTRDSIPTSGEFGDNGLAVAFSSRDAENRAVAAEGSVAMVVVDPAISGPEARVARWDFPAGELKAHYRQTMFGKAYRFDLLWPHGAPRHERLKLFVRLTAPDGERLEAQQTIHVKLGTLLPADDDSNFADSPAPRSEPIVAPSPNGDAATGDDEPDEPVPHGPEPSAVVHNSVVHNGAAWKPYR
jgi:hypothetical protein